MAQRAQRAVDIPPQKAKGPDFRVRKGFHAKPGNEEYFTGKVYFGYYRSAIDLGQTPDGRRSVAFLVGVEKQARYDLVVTVDPKYLEAFPAS